MERKIKWIKRSFFVFIIEGDILRLKNLNNNLQVKHISNQLLDKNIRTPCPRILWIFKRYGVLTSKCFYMMNHFCDYK